MITRFLPCVTLSLLLSLAAQPVAAQTPPAFAHLEGDDSYGFTDFDGRSYFDLISDYWGSIMDEAGRVYVVGASTRGATATRHSQAAIGRFDPAGGLDATFGMPGAGYTTVNPIGDDAWFMDLGVQSDGKVLAAGEAKPGLQSPQPLLARFLSDGGLDPSFGDNGYYLGPVPASTPGFFGISILPDDRIVFAEIRDLRWFSADGRLDSTTREPWNRGFEEGPERLSLLSEPFFLPDLRMLAFVRDNTPEGVNYLARFNADGTRDLSFGTENGRTRLDGFSFSVIGPGRGPGFDLTDAGQIHVYGSQNGALALARLSGEGEFDLAFGGGDGIATFDPTTGEDAARSMLMLGDGRVLLGGDMNYKNRGHALLMTMFMPDGTLDETFGTGGAVTDDGLASSWYGGLHLDSAGRLIATSRQGQGVFNERGDRPVVNRYLTNFTPASTASDAETGQPQPAALKAAYPNPFSRATNLTFSLNKAGRVNLSVYDLLGRRVAVLAEGLQPAGTRLITWRADGLANGLYVVRLERDGQVRTRMVTLVR